MNQQCPQLLNQFQELQGLKRDFELALGDVIESKDLTRAKEIQQEIEEKLEDLKGLGEAEKIMGEDFYGPRDIKEVFGIELSPGEIPLHKFWQSKPNAANCGGRGS